MSSSNVKFKCFCSNVKFNKFEGTYHDPQYHFPILFKHGVIWVPEALSYFCDYIVKLG